jgi:DNA-binding MarR family transcriptional regulator
MTEYEKSVLNIIATSEFNQLNGSIPRTTEESATWLFVDEIAEDAGLSMNQVKGVLGSLVKKGMINIDDIDADETLLQITKKGIDELWIVG